MVHIVSNDGGKSFSTPQRISNDDWVINGCPHTGPAMTENTTGLHFAWFTGGKKKGCYYTNSNDQGKNFIQRDSVSSLGSHPQIAALQNGKLLIAWDESRTRDTVISKTIGIQLRNEQGRVIAGQYITDTAGQASFPMISQDNTGKCIVAYTAKSAGSNHIKYQILNFTETN
jgi:hypothetical protein